MVGAFTRGFWQNLCHALGHPEWIEDPRFLTNALRLNHRAELVGMLEKLDQATVTRIRDFAQ